MFQPPMLIHKSSSTWGAHYRDDPAVVFDDFGIFNGSGRFVDFHRHAGPEVEHNVHNEEHVDQKLEPVHVGKVGGFVFEA